MDFFRALFARRSRLVWGLSLALLPWTSAPAQEKEVLGWNEKVRIFPGDVLIHAKLDSGADYSSLDAGDIEQFKKGDKTWVRFSVTNRYGKKIQLERPVHRTAIIKKRSGKVEKRLVVLLGLCLGTNFMQEEVNLIDRTNFSLQMLVGRSFLAGKALIDSAVTYTTEPSCKEVPAS